jgi:hypothetical protein
VSNTRKRRTVQLAPSSLLDAPPPRCECRHSYELDGRCHRSATARVTLVCQAQGCDCAAEVHLVCAHCLALWRESARRDGVKLRVRAL